MLRTSVFRHLGSSRPVADQRTDLHVQAANDRLELAVNLSNRGQQVVTEFVWGDQRWEGIKLPPGRTTAV